jgi:SAM-dependent methyltransferase
MSDTNSTPPAPSAASARDYVLGTHDEELQRLGFQHQVWRAQAAGAWERARFLPGQRLLDVGCGPGFAMQDLSQIVGMSGRVTGVDLSAKFVETVRSFGLPNAEALQQDVQELDVGEGLFDGAWSRWVLCFVPDPQRVVDRVARALKPGGRFVVQDYYNYATMVIAPKSDIVRKVVSAVDASWRMHGGDPDVGCRLPGMFERAGLRVRHLDVMVRLARPTDLLWHWPGTFFRIFVPTLVKMGLLVEADQKAFEAEWAERSKDPSAFFTSPPMVEVVGEKV